MCVNSTGAVIVAAGSGERMRGYAVKKQFLELGGAPVLEWSLRAFFSSDIIREVVLVAAPGDEVCCEQNFTRLRSGKRFLIVTGGETRQSSVEAGARAVGDDCEYIAVHDGARPFAGGALIRACSEAAARTGAACAAVRVTDTIKSAAGRYVAETPDRSILWAAQTPQTFRRAVLLNALDAARRDGFTATDDVSLVERLGCRVEIVESSYDNIKITTPADYAAALAIAARLTAR